MAPLIFILMIAGAIGLLVWMSNRNSATAPAADPISAPTFHIDGDGDFEQEVVGESYYQDALSAICGGHCDEGHEHECVATLVPEPDNPHDSNAVAVLIEGRKVGHLPRVAALVYTTALARHGNPAARFTCDAEIRGGWRRERRNGQVDEGGFGVWLDLVGEDED